MPDGVHIAWDSTGSGAPVLLMGGAFGARSSFHSSGIVDALVVLGRRVITFDLRGHGESDRPHDAAVYGWRKNAADARAVLEAADATSTDIFGQSMGANICVALLHGDTTRIRSMVGNGAVVLREPYDRPVGFMLKRAKLLREGGMQGLMDGQSMRRLPGEEMSGAAQEACLTQDAVAYTAEAEGQALMLDQWLPAEGIPILLVAGEHDEGSRLTVRDLPKTHPFAHYREMPGKGHFWYRDPGLLTEVLQSFWRTLP